MQLAQLILSSGDFPNSFVITVAPGGCGLQSHANKD